MCESDGHGSEDCDLHHCDLIAVAREFCAGIQGFRSYKLRRLLKTVRLHCAA
jgi:hypothetical protein